MVPYAVAALLVVTAAAVIYQLRSRPGPFRTATYVTIGGGAAEIEIPAGYATEIDEEGTVSAWMPGFDGLAWHFSVMTFRSRDGGDNPGFEQVRRSANERGFKFERHGRRGVALVADLSDPGGDGELAYRWEIGEDEAIVMISMVFRSENRNHPRVTAALNHAPRVIESLRFLRETHTLETVEGTVTYHVSGGPASGDESIRAPDPARQQWITDQLDAAEVLTQRYGGTEFDVRFDPRDLDRVFTNWSRDGSADKPAGDDVACAVGAAYGQFCIDAAGMRWILYRDEHGESLAIEHAHGARAFPIDMVLKRVDSGAVNFLMANYEVLRQVIRQNEDDSES
jgi:hypothetical protein